jgi:tetratricopeptide (TPR) repeat protein
MTCTMKLTIATRAVVIVGLCATAAACGKVKAADHTRRGNTFFEAKRYAEAIIEYRGALQADPKLGEVRLKLADAYVQVNDPRNAMREYVRATDLLPDSVEAHVKAGRFLLLARQFEDAKTHADRVIALDAKNVDAQILRGNALAGLKDFDAAMTEFQDAIALDPSQTVAYNNLGMLQLAKGNKDEAETTFKTAVTAAPSSFAARLALANFYASSGNVPEAETTLKAALQLDPKNLDANRALGVFYLSSGRMAEAEPFFAALAKWGNSDIATLTLADYYSVAKRSEDARRILRELAGHDAMFARANVRIATLDASEGRRSQAQERLREVLDKHPKDTSALLLSARLFAADGKRADARKAANAVVAADARSAAAVQAYMLIGRIEAAADRHDEAIKAYEQVLKLQPRPLAATLALSRLYITAGDASKGATYAQQALGMAPGDPEAQGLLIRTALIEGDVAAATRALATLEKTAPNAIGVAKVAALVQLASKKPDAARLAYQRVLTAVPDDVEALAGLIAIDVAAGRAATAVTRIDEYLKTATPSVDVLMLAARTYAAAQKNEQVEAVLKQAIELDPDRLQAYALLGGFYVRVNRLEEATARFRDVLARNPRSVPAATMVGMLLEVQGRPAEAEEEYTRVLGIDPRAAVAANNLAWLYVESNRKLDEALQLAQTAQQQLPNEPNVNDTLGWIYYRKNLASQALTFLETAARISPNEPSHQLHLGLAYTQTGDWVKARAALNRALALKPDLGQLPEAKKALATIGA